MKNTLIIIILTLLLASANAQDPHFAWVETGLSPNTASGQSVVSDSQGNIYVLVGYQDSIILQDETISYTYSPETPEASVLIKYNPLGEIIWTQNLISVRKGFTTISIDFSDNICIVGSFVGTLNICDTTFTSQYYVAWYLTEGFVSKFNSDGEGLWARRIFFEGGGEPNSTLNKFTDNNGNILVNLFMNTSSYISAQDTILYNYNGRNCLLRYSASGELNLVKQLLHNNYFWFPVADQDNNIYSNSGFLDTLVIGIDTFISNGSSDALLSKYDYDGNYLWGFSFGGIGSDGINDIVISNSSELIFIGHFRDTIEIEGNTFISQGFSDYLVAKFDTAGNFIWAQSMGSLGSDSGFGTRISIDNSENIYISCRFTDTAYFNSDNGISFLPGYYVIKLTKLGDLEWFKRFPENSEIMCSDAYENNIVYVTGRFVDSASFDGIPVIGNPTGYNFFLTKIDTLTTISPTNLSNNNINVFPNPSTEIINISFNELFTGTVKIFSNQGVLVFSNKYHQKTKIQISTKMLKPGFYIIETENINNTRNNKKILIQ